MGDVVACKDDEDRMGKVIGANVLLRRVKVIFENDGDTKIEDMAAEDVECVGSVSATES